MTKVGRPTKYKIEYITEAYKLCLLGATDKQMADFFEVDEATLNRWKEEYSEFRESLKQGKDDYDSSLIEASLRHRASGYSHKAEKIFLDRNGDVIRAEYTEHYPPDPTSMIFWLKNRNKDRWRDKVDAEITGKDGGPLIAQIIYEVTDGKVKE